MGKQKMKDVLTTRDRSKIKTNGDSGGVLTRFFVNILLDLNISTSKWEDYMRDYVNDPRNGVPNNRKDQTIQRGNLTKEFSKGGMTFKIFCKGLRLLKFTKVEFSLKAYHANGKATLHTTSLVFTETEEKNEPTVIQRSSLPIQHSEHDVL